MMDLSFFIWDKKHSRACFAEALHIYKEATSNHETVMQDVMEACGLKGNHRDARKEEEEEKSLFRELMKDIVVSHRLCKLH